MQTMTINERRSRIAVKLALILGILLAALVIGGGSVDGRAEAAEVAPGDCLPHYVGAFGASATDSQNEGFANQTIRMISYSTEGGDAVRVRLSNLFGDQPVTFDAVYVGLQKEQNVAGASPAVDAGTNKRATFGGKSTVTLQPGKTIKSDPVGLRVGALQHLVTSIYVAQPTGPATEHGLGLDEHTSYVAPGNLASNELGAGFVANEDLAYYFLTDIEVRNSNNAATIVGFGDSITDGFNSTPNKDQSYPDHLARRLQANQNYDHLSVSNQGISGNRVLREDRGPRALDRLDRDVLAQPSVTDVIFLEGINDIAGFVEFASEPDPTDPPNLERASAEEIIEGYKKLIDRVHAKGIRIHGGTLLPSGDTNDATPSPVPYSVTYSDPQANREREEVNAWIRTSGEFDSVIDFDAAVRDPQDREEIREEFDSGDNLHPNDAGYQAMANAVPLSLFNDSGFCPQDTTPPTVKRLAPADRATGVALNTNVSAFFSEPMKASSINGGSFKLFKKTGNSFTQVSASVTYDSTNKRALLNPNANLEAGAVYMAAVYREAQDQAGNPLAVRKVWSFTARQ